MATLALPTRTTMVRNILREYRATDGETGRTWYLSAHGEAYLYSREYGTTLEASVGVIAALSPQTQWWQNLMLARQVMAAGAMIQGHTRDTMRKVNAILAGAEPLEVLGGLKVRSFYQNILNPFDDEIVTIDRHAWRTAMGRNPLGTRNAVPTDRAYHAAADAYRHAAKLAHLRPSELQAIVWVPRAA